jgi:four helix bundle protein
MTLQIYPVILELVRRLAPVVKQLRGRSVALAEQMERALISVPLNTAEGAYSRGRNRQARFQTAAASAREALACLETAEAMGFIGSVDPHTGALFHRVIGTLVRLSVPRG